MQGNKILAEINGIPMLEAVDEERPYLKGSIGVSVRDGSHDKYRVIRVRP